MFSLLHSCCLGCHATLPKNGCEGDYLMVCTEILNIQTVFYGSIFSQKRFLARVQCIGKDFFSRFFVEKPMKCENKALIYALLF